MPDDAINEEGATGAATEQGEQGEQESPLDALRREKDALQDRLLRTAAEFENYRKRVDRDRREQAESATADALAAFLPIIDDLERKRALVRAHPFFAPAPFALVNAVVLTLFRPVMVAFLRRWVTVRPVVVLHLTDDGSVRTP